MVKRFPASNGGGGLYFRSQPKIFISTGCTPLDCILSGGWALGRVINIVGDKSTGKTLLAIEAAANFHMQFPRGHIWYRESEAAFDVGYARALGLPLERVDFGPEGEDSLWSTVEAIQDDLDVCLAQAAKSKQPGLYVVDSLDALTTVAEIRHRGQEGFGTEKAKAMSRLLRSDIVRSAKRARVTIIFISQVRDRIGVTFGEKKTRSGGRALEFFASQIVYLSHLKFMVRSVRGNKTRVGPKIRVQMKKNKAGQQTTQIVETDFIIRSLYGIDDFWACLDWLVFWKRLSEKQRDALWKEGHPLQDTDPEAFRVKFLQPQQAAVRREWAALEAEAKPKHAKYAAAPRQSPLPPGKERIGKPRQW